MTTDCCRNERLAGAWEDGLQACKEAQEEILVLTQLLGKCGRSCAHLPTGQTALPPRRAVLLAFCFTTVCVGGRTQEVGKHTVLSLQLPVTLLILKWESDQRGTDTARKPAFHSSGETLEQIRVNRKKDGLIGFQHDSSNLHWETYPEKEKELVARDPIFEAFILLYTCNTELIQKY